VKRPKVRVGAGRGWERQRGCFWRREDRVGYFASVDPLLQIDLFTRIGDKPPFDIPFSNFRHVNDISPSFRRGDSVRRCSEYEERSSSRFRPYLTAQLVVDSHSILE